MKEIDKTVHSITLSLFIQNPITYKVASIFPEQLFRAYLYCLGGLYYLLHPQERGAINNSVIEFLGEDPRVSKKWKLLIKIYSGIFEHYMEKIAVGAFPLHKIIEHIKTKCEIEQRELLDEVLSQGQGLILVTGHFGAVEFLPGVLTLNGYKTAIMLRFKSKKIKDAQEKRARQYGLMTIDVDERGGFYRGIKAIKEGRVLITLCDEFSHWIPELGSKISVLGAILPRDKTLDILYRRAKAPVLAGFLSREKEGYKLKLHNVANADENCSVSARTWSILENYIKNYPEQWYQWNSVARGLATYRLKSGSHNASV